MRAIRWSQLKAVRSSRLTPDRWSNGRVASARPPRPAQGQGRWVGGTPRCVGRAPAL